MVIIHHPGAACTHTIKGYKNRNPLEQSCFSIWALRFAFILAFSLFAQKSKNDGTRNGFLSSSCFLCAYRHIYRYPSTTASIYGWKASWELSCHYLKKTQSIRNWWKIIVDKFPDFENVENCWKLANRTIISTRNLQQIYKRHKIWEMVML